MSEIWNLLESPQVDSHISLYHPRATSLLQQSRCPITSWPASACLIPPSQWTVSRQKKEVCATVWRSERAKLPVWELWKLGSIEMSEPVSVSGDEGHCTLGRGLFCHAGTRGNSCGAQGSTAAIIHLLSWQCPVSQGAAVAKHQRQASIVMLRWSAAMCKWS